jgi:hypothetical protein
MSQTGANLDWAWIEFVALWLLGPLVLAVVFQAVLHHLRHGRHGHPRIAGRR